MSISVEINDFYAFYKFLLNLQSEAGLRIVYFLFRKEKITVECYLTDENREYKPFSYELKEYILKYNYSTTNYISFNNNGITYVEEGVVFGITVADLKLQLHLANLRKRLNNSNKNLVFKLSKPFNLMEVTCFGHESKYLAR